MNGRILVTGGHGFIGHRVVERLRAAGLEVEAPTHDEWDVSAGPHLNTNAETVVHLAGRSFVPASWSDPAGFYRSNAMGTMNVLETCRRVGARLVNVGTFGYGPTTVLPTAESEPLKPGNPYAYSKVAAENACDFYREVFDLPVTTLRVFNVYGPGQPSHLLIPTIIDQAVDPKCEAISVADSTARRDFVHVNDVVSAVVVVALKKSSSAAAYNIGTGQSHSVGDIAVIVNTAAGQNKPLIDRGERRVNEIQETLADIRAIRRDYDWKPSIPFSEGLRSLVAARLLERI